MPQTTIESKLDYTTLAEAILGALRNERDRKIVALRYGLGMPKRHTLERIGSDFGITRERVRQIEKSATAKLKQNPTAELRKIDEILTRHLASEGEVSLLADVSTKLGAETPAQQAYISFLATLSPNVEMIDDSDHYHPSLATLPKYSKDRIAEISDHLIRHLKEAKKPKPIDAQIGDALGDIGKVQRIAVLG